MDRPKLKTKKTQATEPNMKKQIKSALLAAAAVGALASAAQATTYNGDLIIGFTATTGNDVVYDLGAVSQFSSGQSWSLGSILLSGTTGVGVGSSASSASVANLNGVQWGVVGSASSPRSIFSSIDPNAAPPATIPGASGWSSIDSNVRTIYQNMPSAAAGQHFQVLATDTTSWNGQTVAGGGNDFLDNYGSPNITGLGTEALYDTLANGSDPTYIGRLDLLANGTVNFVPVPEPTTYGILAGLGLLALSFRRQVLGKA
jgi:hypothetical protein